MALQWHDRFAAVPADGGSPTGRPPRLIVPGSVLDPEDRSPGWQDSVSTRQIERVAVLPGDGIGNKPSFEIILELGQDLQTSTGQTRTWRETALELEIEERELASYARLSGKNVTIRSKRSGAELRVEALQDEIQRLKDENLRLQKRKASLEEQLQFAVDQLRSG